MRLNSICLITDDVLSLGKFYQKALQVKTEGDKDFMKIFLDGAGLLIFSKEGMETMAPHSTQGMGSGSTIIEIAVDVVDVEYERLQKLDIRIIKPPTTQTWGIRSAWFADPDGNIINFHQKVGMPQ